MNKDIFDQEPDMDGSGNMHVEQQDFTDAPQMVDYDPSQDAGDIPYIPLLKTKPQVHVESQQEPQGAPQKIDPQIYFQKPVNPIDRMKNNNQTASDKSNSVKNLMNTLNNMGEINNKAGKEIITIPDVIECLDSAIEHLSDIDWLPKGKEQLSSKLKKVASPIVDALRSYSKYLKSIE